MKQWFYASQNKPLDPEDAAKQAAMIDDDPDEDDEDDEPEGNDQ